MSGPKEDSTPEKKARSSFRVHFRLYPDSPDERHQALVAWYQQLPRDHAGRVVGLHEHFLDLLYRGLVGGSVDSNLAPRPPEANPAAGAVKNGSAGEQAPRQKKPTASKKKGAEKRPAEKPRLNPTAASVMDGMDGF